MTIGGAFLGGGVELVPAGSCKLVLEIRTEDGANLATTFSVVGGGQTYTATAGADGRAELTVPSGVTYTVTTSATGYDGLAAQTVIGDSATIQYVRFEATLPRVKKSGDTMTGDLVRKSTQYENNDFAQTRHVLGEYEFQDKNGVFSGYLRRVGSTATQYTQIGCVAKINDATVSSSVEAHILPDGTMYANAPSWGIKTVDGATTGTNDESDKIVTLKMLSLDPKVVHTAGNETIGGVKTFTSIPIFPQQITLVSSQSNASVYPSTWRIQSQISFRDSTAEGREVGLVRMDEDSTSKRLLLNNMAIINGTAVNSTIMAIVKNTGEAYATAPSTPTNATSNEIATADWSIGKFVQKSGDTMTGELRIYGTSAFTTLINTKANDFSKFIHLDSTSGSTEWVGVTQAKKWGTNGSQVELIALDRTTSVWKGIYIQNDNGTCIISGVTPSSTSDNSTKIPTTAWINTADIICRTAGNQTIAGKKTFTNDVTIEKDGNVLPICKDTGVELGNKGNNNHRLGLEIWDRKNTIFGQFQTNHSESLNTKSYIGAKDSKGNWRYIELHARNDGTAYAMCPNPDTGDLEKIATANWVNSKLTKKNGLTEFTSWAELEALIKSGKRGDSFNVTMDFTGLAAIIGATSSSVAIHAYGHYFVDNITVSGGEITDAEMFGSGEVQYKVDGSTKTFATTGFGRKQVVSAHVWGFRVPSNGEMGYAAIINNDNITSCSGYYISI